MSRASVVRSPKRALLVGIDDYSASRLHRKREWQQPADRGWPALRGSVRDVDLMRDMLISRYGFAPDAIVTLRNQEATRDAIMKAVEQHLVTPAAKNDVVFFYFAGHGSQVENSASTEEDRRDESLVPADSRLGAPDIRDKELAVFFNRILDRGARLTTIFDSCHSGSVSRALAVDSDVRAVRVDPKDVRDPAVLPVPETRGALVFSASTDVTRAFETEDDQGRIHGAFSWALLRAMRDSVRGEAAADTFLRARAMMRADTPYQDPVIGGTAAVQATPLFSSATGGPVPMSVAIEQVKPDGTVVLQGGWAHGLTTGTVLCVRGNGTSGARIRITSLLGLGRSEGRFIDIARGARVQLNRGTLLDVVTWSASTGRRLRVWMPQSSRSRADLVALAQELRTEARRTGIRWIDDPTVSTPTHLLRWRGKAWELLAPSGERRRVSANASLLRSLPPRSSLFVQLPAPADLAREIGVGPGADYDSIEPRTDPRGVDYVLVGRLSGKAIEYAWMRPAVHADDADKTPLPPRSDWQVPDPLQDAGVLLRRAILRLHTILAWHHLQSPADAPSPYRLALYDRVRNEEVRDGTVRGGGEYNLRLMPLQPTASDLALRYYYAFGIDSFGRSVLLFPLRAVENQFPVDRPGAPRVREIELSGFTVTPPYGVDTYILISTEEALPNPLILESSGVRTRGPRGGTALEELLSRTGGSSRGMEGEDTSPIWSIDRVLIHSVPPESSVARR
jgi:hypothetical protein